MEDFFDFHSRLVMTYFSVYPQIHLDWVINKKLVGGDFESFEFPIVFKHTHGIKMGDLLHTQWPSLYLISNRIEKLLAENNVTGWKTFPIKIFGKKGEEVLGYNGFSVIGRSNSKVIYDNSKIIEKRFVSNGPLCRFYKGIDMDMSKWDGSDFFMPDSITTIYATSKVYTVLSENWTTNVSMKKLSDNEYDEFVVKKLNSDLKCIII
ncbi:MAG TPA: hypothetical protein VK806_04495 [Bacteroidia bacterium]|jgi:hypothetical protein|nr:hypothetical protein [Bacteroidia bacterium]